MKQNPHYIAQASPLKSYLAYQQEIDNAVERVLHSGSYILGQEVRCFEAEFASYLGAKFGIGVGNGTDAISIALRACGIQPGDEVVTVSHTSTATISAIENIGASPVLVDVNPDTYTIDITSMGECLASRVKAIVAVHLYGHPADMSALLSFARSHNLVIIEDCAQAHGTEYMDKKVGNWGDAAAFSFYPTKNLGGFGDGGMVVCNDPEIADQARQLREYGWSQRFISEVPGFNSRLDEIQAAILRVKLQYLTIGNQKRREIAARYSDLLQTSPLILPIERPGAWHSYHQYVVRHPQRGGLGKYLAESCSIGTNVHYPVPIHLQPAYKNRIRSCGTLPVTERIASEILSLPMHPFLTPTQIEVVADAVLTYFS